MIRRAVYEDLEILSELAGMLWSGHTREELLSELEEIMNGQSAFYIAFVDGKAVGFAQCQLRNDYVEGTSSSPVGYLEGIFIKPQCRRKGIGRELIRCCEKWAAEAGCTEFASDCETDNKESFDFHMSSGFKEANRIICFVKSIQ